MCVRACVHACVHMCVKEREQGLKERRNTRAAGNLTMKPTDRTRLTLIFQRYTRFFFVFLFLVVDVFAVMTLVVVKRKYGK